MSDLFKQARDLEVDAEELCNTIGSWCGGEKSTEVMVRQALDVAKLAQQLADACEREAIRVEKGEGDGLR